MLRVPSGLTLPLIVLVVLEEDGDDWLDIGIPMGALGHLVGDEARGFYTVWNEVDAPPVPVVREVEDWFADLAGHVFAAVSFELGLIGWEVSGTQDSERLQDQRGSSACDLGALFPEGNSLHYAPRTAYPLI